jgi:hypothetical protein
LELVGLAVLTLVLKVPTETTQFLPLLLQLVEVRAAVIQQAKPRLEAAEVQVVVVLAVAAHLLLVVLQVHQDKVMQAEQVIQAFQIADQVAVVVVRQQLAQMLLQATAVMAEQV